jgi:isocitrate dehydrogenase
MDKSSRTVVVVPGDGIGPAITESVKSILSSADVELNFIDRKLGKDATAKEIEEAMSDFEQYGIMLKGPTETPIATEGKKSFNVTSRKGHGLFVNFRRSQSFEPIIKTHFPAQDITVFRENEEGLYAAIEHQLTTDTIQAISLKSLTGMHKIIRAAFEYAYEHQKKICCMHKGNILKKTEGTFLEIFNQMALEYPTVKTSSQIIDDGMAKVATNPNAYQVIVTENLFGDILSDITTALTGSLGLGGSSNIGYHGAMFEAIHGTGPSILPGGRDNPSSEHIANPSGLLQAALLMLEHIGGEKNLKAKQMIQRAWLSTLEDGLHTRDLAFAMNGVANPTTKKVLTTNQFTDEVRARIKALKDNQVVTVESFQRLLDPMETKVNREWIQKLKRTKPYLNPLTEEKTVGMDIFVKWTGKEDPAVIKAFQAATGINLAETFQLSQFCTLQELYDYALWFNEVTSTVLQHSPHLAKTPFSVPEDIKELIQSSDLSKLDNRLTQKSWQEISLVVSSVAKNHKALITAICGVLGKKIEAICQKHDCKLEMISNRGQSVYPYIMNPDLVDQMRCRVIFNRKETCTNDEIILRQSLIRVMEDIEQAGIKRIKFEGLHSYKNISTGKVTLGFGESYGQGMGTFLGNQ